MRNFLAGAADLLGLFLVSSLAFALLCAIADLASIMFGGA